MSRDKIKKTVIDFKLEDLSDGLPDYTGFANYCIKVNADGNGLEYGVPVPAVGGYLFTLLEDGPGSYSGAANKIVKVNGAASAIVFGETVDTDIALAADSDSRIPSQHAVKTYIDGKSGIKMVTANTGTSYSIDLSLGAAFNLTLNGDCTFTFPSTGTADIVQQFWIYLKRDTTPNRIITWDTDVRWPMNITPALDGTAETLTIFRFSQLGNAARWYGEVLGMGYAI